MEEKERGCVNNFYEKNHGVNLLKPVLEKELKKEGRRGGDF